MEIVQGWESLSAMILLVLAFSEGVWGLHEAGRKEGGRTDGEKGKCKVGYSKYTNYRLKT